MPELVFFRRGEELLRVAVGRTRLVLGRGVNSDVVIPDPSVSRQHVALHFDGTRCLLEDLSGQGTLVAGQLVKHGELLDGVDLSLGPWSAIFRLHSVGTLDGPTSVGQRTDVQPREAPQEALPPPSCARSREPRSSSTSFAGTASPWARMSPTPWRSRIGSSRTGT